jgi:polysaccharide biosynthesis protein PelA
MKARHFGPLVAVVMLLCGTQLDATSNEARAGSEPGSIGDAKTINREILGLYDGATEPMVEFSRLHKYLEMPLNHLGYKLTLRDLRTGLPDPTETARYRAVATWFSGRVSDADAYLAWAANATKAGTRFVVIDSVGAIGNSEDLPAINGFLSQLGITQAAYYVGDTKETRIDRLNPTVIAGEVAHDPAALPPHNVFIANSTASTTNPTVHLSVIDPAHRWVKASAAALVTTSRRGGFVAPGYAIRYDAAANRVQWLIEPFRFLEAALGHQRAPVPDTTTVSGRRLYFSHIDGDGWNNATDVQPYASQGQHAAQVMLDHLIVPYPDLPVTVGLIAGDVTPTDGGLAEGTATAKAMFALPNVEVASHTHTHPFHWSQFKDYNRDREITNILATLETRPPLEDRSLKALVDKWRAAAPPITLAGSSATAAPKPPSADLPRARPHQPFDLEREVKGALDVSTSLAPQGKRAQMYLWSGDCRPFEDVLKATRLAGVRNLNGGDSRYDAAFPSKAYVPPLSRMVGAERQIYAVNSNENTYTHGWTGPFDAFKTLSETLDNTELPRRLKGFNVYYHSFSATKIDGVAAVRANLDKARASRLAPITASQYAEIAEGFFTTRIIETAPDRWAIKDRGALNTMRFDDAKDVAVDYDASVGVIGANTHAGSLYVTLDPAVTEPQIAVRPSGKTSTGARLTDSRWALSAVQRSACEVTANAQGFGVGEMSWRGLLPGVHIVTATRRGAVLAKQRLTADAQGRLTARLATSAVEPLELRITCATDPPAVASAEPTPPAPAVAPKSSARAKATPAAAQKPRPTARKQDSGFAPPR